MGEHRPPRDRQQRLGRDAGARKQRIGSGSAAGHDDGGNRGGGRAGHCAPASNGDTRRAVPPRGTSIASSSTGPLGQLGRAHGGGRECQDVYISGGGVTKKKKKTMGKNQP